MHKANTISPQKVLLTPLLSTAILIACTPSQQQGHNQSQIKPLPLPEKEVVLLEEDAEIKTSISKLPQAVKQDSLDKQKVHMGQPGR